MPIQEQQQLFTYDQVQAEFSRLFMRVRCILDDSPNSKSNLKRCIELCIYLKASDGERLFNAEKLEPCKSFKQLFVIINEHITWDELSILTEIVDECDSDSAARELEYYNKKIAVSKALEIISSTESNPPPGFEKFCVIIDKPYKKLTVEEYEKTKKFIFDNLEVRHYVNTRYLRVLFDSLHLEWHVVVVVIPHMIEMAYERQENFKEKSYVYMQIGKEIIIDTHKKPTSTVSLIVNLNRLHTSMVPSYKSVKVNTLCFKTSNILSGIFFILVLYCQTCSNKTYFCTINMIQETQYLTFKKHKATINI